MAATADTALRERATAVAAWRPSLVWLVPLLYPMAFPAIFHSAELMRAGVPSGIPLLAMTIAWSFAGPVAAWLTLNYLDENDLDRKQFRLVVMGALLSACCPPLFNLTGAMLRIIGYPSLHVPAWYVVTALVAASSLLPASDYAAPSATFRRIHGHSAILLASFVLVHVSNHVLGIVSIQKHFAVMQVLRVVYRKPVVEALLIAIVATQVVTGATMLWKSRLRSTTTLRNLQTVSGLYLAVFFVSHLNAVFTTRPHQDTTFAWATNAPAGLLASAASARLLPLYGLAVLVVFVHLGSQARWNLRRITSESAARNVSYGVMALGVIVATTIALAACGVHLVP